MHLTPWVQRLLITNVAVYLLSTGSPLIRLNFGFIPSEVLARPWTVITYMFLHADMTHLIFNMIGLFFFGPRLEGRLGGRGFLWLYFLAGIGGAVLTFIFDRNVLMIGASGAVYGIVAGFAYLWPKERIYIWGVLPIEAWLLAVLAVGASLYSGITGGGNIAHFAHLGGLAFGYGYVKWKTVETEIRKKNWRDGKLADKPTVPTKKPLRHKRNGSHRWENISTAGLHKLNREEIDALLDKISAEGVESLTESERDFLDRMSNAN